MFASRNTTTNKNAILVTECDSFIGFYPAWALLQHREKTGAKDVLVVCAVRDRDNDFVRELEKLGAEIREFDTNMDAERLMRDLFRDDVTSMLLVPVHTDKPSVSVRLIEAAELTRGRVKNLLLWSTIGAMHHGGGGSDNSAVVTNSVFKDIGSETKIPMATPTTTPTRRDDDNDDKDRNDKNAPWNKVFLQFAQLEKRVRECKIQNECIWRIGFVQQEFFGLANVIQNRGIFPLTSSSAKMAPLNAKDLGRAAAHVLIEHTTFSKLNKQMLILTGPKLYDAREMVQIANSELKAKIEFKEVSVDEMHRILTKDEDMDKMERVLTAGNFALFKEMKLDQTTDELKKLLGSEPADLKTFFRENGDSFRPRA
ncbi:hypothetical protein BC828DRAFT_207855 [Blastocladiella britannica]|nr:hypothetical protein BC828DRAFT_207855 [Blastocladiella britannica]